MSPRRPAEHGNRQQARRFTDPDPEDVRYPRQPPLSILRWVLLAIWALVVSYVSKAGGNLLGFVSTDNKVTAPAVFAALLVPKRVFHAGTPIWVYAVSILAVSVSIAGCAWATYDRGYEFWVMRARVAYRATLRALNIRPPFDNLAPPDLFVGRQTDLEWLLERLRSDATRVVAIWGLTGIGKTALAGKVIQQLIGEDRFPGGVAAVSCQELQSSTEILWQVLIRFDPQRPPSTTSDLNELGAVAHRLIGNKRAMVVLDGIGAGTALEQSLKVLLDVGAIVLLTMQEAPSPSIVPRQQTRKLNPLPLSDAVNLFRESLIQSDAQGFQPLRPSQEAAIRSIVSTLGNHTYAVKLVAASIADQHRSLERTAHELESQPRHSASDTQLQRIMHRAFNQSVEKLPSDIQHLFITLAAFTTSEFSQAAVMTLAEALEMPSPDDCINGLLSRALVEAFTDNHMPEDSDQERLRLHPLLKQFIQDRFSHLAPDEQESAYTVIANYYADYGARVPDVALVPDEGNIISALDWAHESRQLDLVLNLCLVMGVFWRNRWRLAAALHYLPWGIEAADRLDGETDDQDRSLRVGRLALIYGQVLHSAGQLDDAELYVKRALNVFETLPDRLRQGIALTELGWIAWQRAQTDLAETLHRQSLAIYRGLGDRQQEATALYWLGEIAKSRRQLKEAEAYQLLSLRLRNDVVDRQGKAKSLLSLGRIARQRRKLRTAERYVREALTIFVELQDQQGKGAALEQLGRISILRAQRWVVFRMSRLRRAQDNLRAALAIAREMEDPRGQGLALYHLAHAGELINDRISAESHYRDALSIFQSAQCVVEVADTQAALGNLLIRWHNNVQEGCSLLQDALSTYQSLHIPGARDVQNAIKRHGCGAYPVL